jgi:DNA helicase-2/ATP-dependent DNA helicase PcrA
MSIELLTQDLNPEQKEAVLSTHPALLVLAGAGSGKTRVLTRRIAHLLASGEISPHEFLAVTFTNKAAAEMKDRIVGLLERMGFPPPTDMWVSTFHSMGAKILREHIHLLEYPTAFTIYDGDDQLKVIKAILKELDINDKAVSPKSVREAISKAKGEAIYPHETDKLEAFWIVKFQEIYTLYEKRLFDSNALDFSDLLFKTYDLLLSYPDVLKSYKQQFKHILIDEYQDTNALQYNLIKLLAEDTANLFVVGDEDQSIYSWRGANIANINKAESDFLAYKIKLEQNYRSTQTIVEASNAVIANNSLRNEKILRTDNELGSKIQIYEANTEYDEAKSVTSRIAELIAQGVDPSEISIFYRLNSQSRVLEEQLLMKGIPHKILGGLRFYERKEIKDILAYMKVSLNPSDEVSLLRVINVPARGIGKKTIETLLESARRSDVSLYQTLVKLKTEPLLKPGPRKKVLSFLELLEKLMEQTSQPLTNFYHEILDLTAYVIKLKTENTSEADARIDNLEELDNALTYFQQERGNEATISQFLEETALISDVDDADFYAPQVNLMTLHVSKGLEFDQVFIVGIEEGLLPSIRQDQFEEDISELEEERRLMYVGMTRARKNLSLSYCHSRKVWGQDQANSPSRFINEIPEVYYSLHRSSFGGNLRSSTASWRQKVKSSFTQQNSDPFPDYDNDGFFPDEDDFVEQTTPYKKGTRVRHPVFGVGSVAEVEGEGELAKVKIVFQNNHEKKFVAKYARLEII